MAKGGFGGHGVCSSPIVHLASSSRAPRVKYMYM